ncbi:MAG: DUF402 domain-containing protein [Clostridiales bacterium]|nr:DUF402 domain-containing protein [Clostridiales bacterium]
MHHKRLDRDTWKDIKKKRYIQKRISTPFGDGYAALLYLDDVDAPVAWNFPEGKVTVCEKGMKWLELLPENDHYLITAMISPEGKINEWYIDMIAGWGFDDDGVIYYDDLYLELIATPAGTIIIDDMDELEQALAEKDITTQQYEMAIATMKKLKSGLLSNLPRFSNQCLSIMHRLEQEHQ